ncbi:MAG: Holliday junction branch migration DNA helicase RuvB [Thermosulfidibacteraceae bacterium]|jgi:Holliday junction DNA helicase RuvB
MVKLNHIRPKNLDDFIGQEKVKGTLRIFLEASRLRNEPLDHMLLCGPPGVGKTSLAFVVASELNRRIKITSGPAIERQGDLIAMLTTLEEGEVLFIDEIHRLSRSIEEVLYSAMEDFAVDVVLGSGPGARSVRLNLARFTLIGATTREGLISAPLRSRFGIVVKLGYYTLDELKEIVKRSASIFGVDVADDAAYEIARRSRGTPRIAISLLRRVRDFGEVKGIRVIDLDLTMKAFEELGIDEFGLDNVCRRLLMVIVENYSGGPVGLDTLSISLGEDRRTIEEVYEPFLIREGFIKRTSKGRMATVKAFEYIRGLSK